jgi:crossover junction endodeoxyribonuclease RuvC
VRPLYLGIDPGLSGGYALMDSLGQVLDASPFPLKKTGGKSILDAQSLYWALQVFLEGYKTKILCSLELVHAMPRQGVVSMFTFGKNYGMLLGILSCLNIEHVEVSPQRWKKLLFGGTTPDKSKSIQHAKLLCLSQDFIHIRRGGKPHDGVADAICLADYARKTFPLTT